MASNNQAKLPYVLTQDRCRYLDVRAPLPQLLPETVVFWHFAAFSMYVSHYTTIPYGIRWEPRYISPQPLRKAAKTVRHQPSASAAVGFNSIS
jgi:hypothetical protein